MKTFILAAALFATPVMATTYLCDATVAQVNANKEIVGDVVTVPNAATVKDYGDHFVFMAVGHAVISDKLDANGTAVSPLVTFSRKNGEYLIVGGGAANMASNCRATSK
ncbi:hypothetical protein [Leclercia sp.]|uniref:hypothetical protein n=1 Tax=Leclercia sp. TaxID=1898428 RepID=UPI0028A71BFC|nr:hypothetical protein [Leclercia sp.]